MFKHDKSMEDTGSMPEDAPSAVHPPFLNVVLLDRSGSEYSVYKAISLGPHHPADVKSVRLNDRKIPIMGRPSLYRTACYLLGVIAGLAYYEDRLPAGGPEDLGHQVGILAAYLSALAGEDEYDIEALAPENLIHALIASYAGEFDSEEAFAEQIIHDEACKVYPTDFAVQHVLIQRADRDRVREHIQKHYITVDTHYFRKV